MKSRFIKLKPNEVKHLGLKPKHHNGYSLGIDKLRQLYIYRGFDEAIIDECIDKGIKPEKVNYYWHKSEKFSINAKGQEDSSLIQQLEDILENVILKHSNTLKIKNDVNVPLKDKKALKVTISDSHVGMNPNLNSGSLFQYEYNAKVYKESMSKVHQSILKEFTTHGTFEVLFLDDLGDLADGWNGYTTRGGHELPQNMTNAEVFETCLDAKIEMIDRLVADNIANKIVLRCVVNDNHSGDFSLIINKAIKKLIELKYSNKLVEVDILERFIEHRVYGNHCFLLTHGKDKAQMKSGLPIILNDRAIRLITDYIEHYEINSKFIHLEKGDLHQIGYQRTKKFDYRNFMSFAPPSAWIQHNFGDSYSGYSIQVIPKNTNEISHTDYFLDYKKIK